MKKNYLLLFLSFAFCILSGQQLQWIDTIKYSNRTNAKSLCIDQNLNVYVSGAWGSYYCCGPGGIYFNKYDASGTFVTMDTVACPYNTNFTDGGAATDNQNNLYQLIRNFSSFKLGGITYPPATYLIKRNSSGQVIWTVTQNFDYPLRLITDNDDNVYASFITGGGSSVKKYSPSGVCIKTYTTGGYMATDGVGNLYIMSSTIEKYNANGDWQWTYQNISPNSQITVDPSGNCYLHEGNDPNGSVLRKINQQGQLLWSVPMWMTATGGACMFSNNVYLAGISGNDEVGKNIELRKIDFNGSTLWSHQIPVGSYLEPYYPVTIKVNQNGLYLVAVKTQNYYTFLLKFIEPDIPTSIKKSQVESNLSISPNPSCCIFSLSYKNETTGSINIKVYDALGKVVYTKSVKNFTGELNETIDLTGFAKGVYTLELTNGTSAGASTGSANSSVFKETRKLVVE